MLEPTHSERERELCVHGQVLLSQIETMMILSMNNNEDNNGGQGKF